MYRSMYKSKIHRVKVTQTVLEYEGSITIDENLMKEADIIPNEKVHVLNLNNGSRIETYAMVGEAGSGKICLNGAAARCGNVGDEVIIISYVMLEEAEAKKHKPKAVVVDGNNRIKETVSVE